MTPLPSTMRDMEKNLNKKGRVMTMRKRGVKIHHRGKSGEKNGKITRRMKEMMLSMM